MEAPGGLASQGGTLAWGHLSGFRGLLLLYCHYLPSLHDWDP